MSTEEQRTIEVEPEEQAAPEGPTLEDYQAQSEELAKIRAIAAAWLPRGVDLEGEIPHVALGEEGPAYRKPNVVTKTVPAVPGARARQTPEDGGIDTQAIINKVRGGKIPLLSSEGRNQT